MKEFLRNYLLNVVIAGVFLLLISMIQQSAFNFYYKYAPISTFYTGSSIFAPDVCYGDTEQILISDRVVKGTDTGFNAIVIRELYIINDGILSEYFKERREPFIQAETNGANSRVQQLPELAVGEYQWILYITLFINGVERSDVPPLKSNEFEVKICITQ